MIKVLDARASDIEELYLKLSERNHMELGDVLERVQAIVSNVRKNGDAAILEYTTAFDKVTLNLQQLRVSKEEIDAAYNKVDSELIEVIRRAKANIEDFHLKQQEKSWFTTGENGIVLGQMYRPLEVVGVYVPGGSAPLPSSVLMNALPAKVAGVKRLVMATPPGKDGNINPAILVAAREAGVDEIYRMGGAQAIAALAFGTKTVPSVDKIVGPGNIYVNTAKRLVFGYCDIDMFAGPSEITVVADDTANPRFIAADLLSQAEHDPLAASVLVTTSEGLAKEVQLELEKQTAMLERKDIVEKSLKDYGMVVLTKDIDQAIEMVNRIAPEHLELCVEDPFSLLGDIKNAGAIFLGNYSPEPLGDYFAGPNHVLPTSGTARFFSPLNVGDFIKKSSVISYSRKALEKVSNDVVRFAEAEGLTAHANAIRVRFDN